MRKISNYIFAQRKDSIYLYITNIKEKNPFEHSRVAVVRIEFFHICKNENQNRQRERKIEPPTNEQKRNGYRKMNSMKQEQKKNTKIVLTGKIRNRIKMKCKLFNEETQYERRKSNQIF